MRALACDEIHEDGLTALREPAYGRDVSKLGAPRAKPGILSIEML